MCLSVTFSYDDALVMSMQSQTEAGLKHVTISFIPAKPVEQSKELEKPVEIESEL